MPTAVCTGIHDLEGLKKLWANRDVNLDASKTRSDREDSIKKKSINIAIKL
jgi:hypothetical protein